MTFALVKVSALELVLVRVPVVSKLPLRVILTSVKVPRLELK
jgi:hypothetical protein